MPYNQTENIYACIFVGFLGATITHMALIYSGFTVTKNGWAESKNQQPWKGIVNRESNNMQN